MVQFETYLFQLPMESLTRSPELLCLQKLFVLLFALANSSMLIFLFMLVLL